MNMRVWGGWVLVVVGISILMTIGCDKGGSGIRMGSLKGRIVDATQQTKGVGGVRVTMVSANITSSGSGLPMGQMRVALTNDDGTFYFSDVQPDSLKLEAIKPGYNDLLYPGAALTSQSSSGNSAPSPGEASIKKGIKAQVSGAPSAGGSLAAGVWLTSGVDFDVGTLYMTRNTSWVEEDSTSTSASEGNIQVKIIYRDNSNKSYVSPDTTLITTYFDGLGKTHTVKEWREGKTGDGTIIEIPRKAGTYTLDVVPQTDAYIPHEFYLVDNATGRDATATWDFHAEQLHNVPGSRDILMDFYLAPRSYDILLRCVNVPDSLLGEVVNVYAETIPADPSSSSKVVATHSTAELGEDLSTNLPATIRIDKISLPINLRVQVKGYRDEILQISAAKIPAGTEGLIRIDVDFTYNNQTNFFAYDPLIASQGGMFDNRVGRTLILRVAGLEFTATDTAKAIVNGVEKGPASSLDQSVDLIFPNVPIGRRLDYLVTINPLPGSRGYASGAYTLPDPTAEDAYLTIPPDTESLATPYYFRVNAVRPSSTTGS